MDIFQNLNFQLHTSAVCIGKFDGLHKGHRVLLETAKKSGYQTVMITFGMNRTDVLYSEREKKVLAEKAGVDVFVVLPFDERLKRQSPEEFVGEVLCERCHAACVVVGSDFRFGYQRSGDAEVLKELGKKYGFETVVIDKMITDGEEISSTKIRSLVEEGKLEKAEELLGTPYFMNGVVQRGHQLGRKIESPTANLYPEDGKVLPPYGVYAVRVQIGEKIYGGVANLGRKPTIGEQEPLALEVWLFDYEGELYGTEITVFFLRFIRRECKFDSLEMLKKQIAADAREARKILDEVEGLSTQK